MFLSLVQRWSLGQEMSETPSTTLGADDSCIVVPLEDSVRLTREHLIFRGEFFATEETSVCSQPLLIMLPVATSRVRLVCFDLVLDAR